MKPAAVTTPRPRARSAAFAGFITVAIVSILLLACQAPPARATSGGLEGKVVILVVDRVGMQDFPTADTPFCLRLANRWSVGMLVTHTAERETGREPDLGADYVTLSAGVRSRGAKDAGLSYNSTEKPYGRGDGRTAGELYESYTGRTAPASGVVCLGFTEVLSNNDSIDNKDNPGLLGGRLREAGRRPAVVGNCDSLERAVRLAPLICGDEHGAVPLGEVSDITQIPSGASPGGYRASISRLLQASERLLPAADLLVVDTGDTGRVDRQYADLDPYVLERDRAAALRRVDRLAERLASRLDLGSSLLLIVSPGAPVESRAEGDYLTPFIAAGKGFGRGLLTSPSTRRPGLVSNVDFLPTALDFFGMAAPSSALGSAMATFRRSGDNVEYLRRLDAQLGVTRKARWPIVTAYLLLCVIEVCLVVFCLPSINARLRWPRDPRRLARFTRVAAVVLMAGPLSFMAVSAFHYDGYLFPSLFCAGFMLVVGLGAWILQRGRPRMDPVVAICLLTASVMVADLFMGGRLVLLPLLGDSALAGMRFYGLSNTLTGILLGVSFWGVSGLAGKKALAPGPSRWVILVVLLALSFVIGFGALGANVGGFITALATTLIFFFATSSRGFTGWRTAFVAGATAAGTALMIVLDSAFVHTHAGKVISGGANKLAPLIQRKLVIQIGQISFLLLPALVLIAAVVALALWMRRPGSFWRKPWEEEKLRTATIFSLLVGSLIAMVFNDTGVAMLGTMTLVSALAMSYYLSTSLSKSSASPMQSVSEPPKPTPAC